jgi:hypothetical protein
VHWLRLDLRASSADPPCLAKCGQRTLKPEVVWDRDLRLGGVSCVAMMQPADHREGDDLPSVDGLPLARFGGVLVEREVGQLGAFGKTNETNAHGYDLWRQQNLPDVLASLDVAVCLARPLKREGTVDVRR